MTRLFSSRDDRIRTCGPFVPNEVRYQSALHPEQLTLEDSAQIHCFSDSVSRVVLLEVKSC